MSAILRLIPNFGRNLQLRCISAHHWLLKSIVTAEPRVHRVDTNKVPTAKPMFFVDLPKEVRQYALPAAQRETCWSCKKFTYRKDKMHCAMCGKLLEVDIKFNYFDLLNVPVQFEVDLEELKKQFRLLQAIVHPDKYSRKPYKEQANSANWSGYLNQAYKTLAKPWDRASYLLQLNGYKIPQQESDVDKEFLLEMLERNVEVENVKTNEELEKVSEKLDAELNIEIAKLSEKFQTKAFEEVEPILLYMRYLLSIEDHIKRKKEELMAT